MRLQRSNSEKQKIMKSDLKKLKELFSGDKIVLVLCKSKQGEKMLNGKDLEKVWSFYNDSNENSLLVLLDGGKKVEFNH